MSIFIIRKPDGTIWDNGNHKVAWVNQSAAKNAWQQKEVHWRDEAGGWDREAVPNGWTMEEIE